MSNWVKWVAAFDLHGDWADLPTVSVLFNFMESFKPKIRIFGGDLWDFACLRSGASHEDKRVDMEADYNAGMEFLKTFRPHHFILGNHDWRLWEHAAGHRHNAVQSYAKQGVREIESWCAKRKCQLLPYHKREGVLDLGKARFLHGFHGGVRACQEHYASYRSCFFGHIHAFDSYAGPSFDGPSISQSVGCLANPDMDYNRKQPKTLRQTNGWAYGVLNKETGGYHYWLAQRHSGEWLIPTDIVTFK